MVDDEGVRFRPRLTLQTLGRGDGLLGLTPVGAFGPRGGQVTVAWADWVYTHPQGLVWTAPAAPSVLSLARSPAPAFATPEGAHRPFHRQREAEAEALDRLRAMGLRPLPHDALQWRAPALAAQLGGPERPLWSLIQEEDFGDFWAEQVPVLQREDWQVVVRPGFAYQSTPVSAWRLVVRSPDGEPVSWEIGRAHV